MPSPKPGLRAISVSERMLRIMRDLQNPIYRYPGITFDDIPDGTILDTYFATPKFSVAGATGSVYVREDSMSATPKNIVSLIPPPYWFTAFDRRSGGIQVNFFFPVNKVSIDATAVFGFEGLGGSNDHPFIQAFDSGNNFLGKTLYPIKYNQPHWGEWKTLLFQSSSRNIAYVQFSCQHTEGGIGIYGMFDNLAYGNDSGPDPTPFRAPIPEGFNATPEEKKALTEEMANLELRFKQKKLASATEPK
jgi:hypothetical protein